ncbi:tetratricopeptide repeat protein [Candidatus Avelusimicrobium luingense]|uniref:tetratricopeptide repeat protein n=1 Tax=Candidatus Avelusimicrobium luingense TaxID=3416211 RepID=UPI003D0D9897
MRKWGKIVLALWLTANTVLPLRAEIKLPPDVMLHATQGINGVYSLDYPTAQKNIQEVFDAYPDHPFAHFGNAMIAWSRYEYEFETSDDKQRKVFEKILDDSIAGIKRWIKTHPDDPNAYMGIGALYGLRALFSMRNRNWVVAYFSGRRAINNLEKSLALDPSYYDAFFGLGIYQYFAGTLPTVIKVLAKIVAIKGDPDEGVRQLNMARQKAMFTSDSAKLILIEVQNTRGSKFYNPQKSLEFIRELRAKYPTNPLMHYVEVICLYETGHYNDVTAQAQYFLDQIGHSQFYKDIYISRAYTALGTVQMAQGNFEAARDLFEQGRQAVKNQEPSRWGVWNELRLGQVYDILGEREKARKQYQYVLSFKDKWGFDEQAKSLLKKPYVVPETGVGPLPPQAN